MSHSMMKFLREFSIPLIAGVLFALVWANISPDSYHEFIHHSAWGLGDIHFWTNDVFMVFFFGIAAVEITSSLGPGGSLSPFHKAINPLLATIGGVAGPVGVFLLLNHLVGSPGLARGWGIPTATDIAIAWLVARLAFGKSHPCVSFLLLLAVADDAISLAIIAIFYPSHEHPVAPQWLLLVVAGMIVAFVLRRRGVRSYWPYLLAGGVCAWFGLHEAHLHPALALVAIVPFMPNQNGSQSLPEEDHGGGGRCSTLITFEHEWKLVVDFGLFFLWVMQRGGGVFGGGQAYGDHFFVAVDWKDVGGGGVCVAGEGVWAAAAGGGGSAPS